jgi:hypothetical protein
MSPNDAIKFLRTLLVTSDRHGHDLSPLLKNEAAEALNVLQVYISSETENDTPVEPKKRKYKNA